MARYIEESEIRRMIIRRGWMDEKKLAESSVVDNLPTADVRENVHSYWEDGYRPKFDGTRYWFRKCHVCGYERNDDNEDLDTPFCPNCGNSMDGAKMKRSDT